MPDPDIAVSEPDPRRAGFVNERALIEIVVEAVHARVRSALHARRFPLLYGCDCAGLLFVDGHDDATTL